MIEWKEGCRVIKCDEPGCVNQQEGGATHMAAFDTAHKSGWKIVHDGDGPDAATFCPEHAYEYVEHPQHYGGADDPYECIKVIEAWELGFCLGSAVRYISRAGKKPGEDVLRDLKKARWYIDREIARRSK